MLRVRAGRSRLGAIGFLQSVSPVSRGSDSGSAAVEFVLVGPLVLLVFAAVVQIGLTGYVRSVLVAAAADGARAGAMSGAPAGSAVRRTQKVLEGSVAQGAVVDVSESVRSESGIPAVTVTVQARLPLFGLLGPETLTANGRALKEAR